MVHGWKFSFVWYDIWVGFYWSRGRKILYVSPLPCCVFSFWRWA